MRTFFASLPASLVPLVLLVGCGSSTQVTTVNVSNVTQNVSVAWGEAGPSRQVDFDDPRLARAMEETTTLVGRTVDFRFDVRMMPRPVEGFFESFFERYVGRIPRDLAQLARRDADVFAYGLAHLRAIHFDYDGSVRDPDLTFEQAEGILRMRMSGGELVPSGAMSYALRRAYLEHLRRTYAGAQIDRLEQADLPHYFRYVREIGDRGDREARAKMMLDVLALDERLQRERGVDELRAAVRTFLLRKADQIRHEHQRRGAELAALPPSSPWHEAERAFVAFVQREWPRLGPDEQRRLLGSVFVRRFNAGREGDPFLREPFPGLDRLALALDVIDRWARDGHPRPYPVSERDAQQRLYDDVVCAPRRYQQHRYQRSRCDSEVYRFASTDPEQRARLLDEVRRRRDPALTEALIANLKWISSPFLLDAWRHFEDDAEHWAIATRVIADLTHHSGAGNHAELYDDAARLWRARPDRRGALLYVLAQIDYPTRSRLVQWDRFDRVFGAPATRADLDVFLSHGEEAVVRIPAIVPALARNVNVGDALVPHLDPLIADDGMRRRHSFFPHNMLRDLVQALRERRDTASLTSLRRYLQQRATAHPSEARGLETLIQMSGR